MRKKPKVMLSPSKINKRRIRIEVDKPLRLSLMLYLLVGFQPLSLRLQMERKRKERSIPNNLPNREKESLVLELLLPQVTLMLSLSMCHSPLQ